MSIKALLGFRSSSKPPAPRAPSEARRPSTGHAQVGIGELRLLGQRIGGVDLDATGIRSKLAEIPFTSKEELLAEQDAEPPFGRIVCVPPSPGSRVFSTSGTTGNSFLRVFSDNDWRRSTASIAESVRHVAPPATY